MSSLSEADTASAAFPARVTALVRSFASLLWAFAMPKTLVSTRRMATNTRISSSVSR